MLRDLDVGRYTPCVHDVQVDPLSGSMVLKLLGLALDRITD
jgi:hypothetical protein